MYEKGIETSNKIYNEAKKLFYEYGYKKTTIKKIAQCAKVPSGLVTYYFKTKDQFVKKIYSDYLINIMNFLDETLEDKINSTLLHHTISTRIYYNNILTDKKNLKFAITNSNFNVLYNRVDIKYKKILSEFSIYIPDQVFKAYITAEFGARHELLLRYYEKEINLPIQELVNVIASIAPKSFSIDNSTINSILYKSLVIYNNIDASKIKFLV